MEDMEQELDSPLARIADVAISAIENGAAFENMRVTQAVVMIHVDDFDGEQDSALGSSGIDSTRELFEFLSGNLKAVAAAEGIEFTISNRGSDDDADA